VQQHEAERSAKTEATSAVTMRIMMTMEQVLIECGVPGDHWCRAGKSFGWSHVSWLAWSWCGTWAAGSCEKRGSGGNEGKFHGIVRWFLFKK